MTAAYEHQNVLAHEALAYYLPKKPLSQNLKSDSGLKNQYTKQLDRLQERTHLKYNSINRIHFLIIDVDYALDFESSLFELRPNFIIRHRKHYLPDLGKKLIEFERTIAESYGLFPEDLLLEPTDDQGLLAALKYWKDMKEALAIYGHNSKGYAVSYQLIYMLETNCAVKEYHKLWWEHIHHELHEYFNADPDNIGYTGRNIFFQNEKIDVEYLTDQKYHLWEFEEAFSLSPFSDQPRTTQKRFFGKLALSEEIDPHGGIHNAFNGKMSSAEKRSRHVELALKTWKAASRQWRGKELGDWTLFLEEFKAVYHHMNEQFFNPLPRNIVESMAFSNGKKFYERHTLASGEDRTVDHGAMEREGYFTSMRGRYWPPHEWSQEVAKRRIESARRSARNNLARTTKKLIGAVRQLFGTQNFTKAALARSAGVSRTTVYRHWGLVLAEIEKIVFQEPNLFSVPNGLKNVIDCARGRTDSRNLPKMTLVSQECDGLVKRTMRCMIDEFLTNRIESG